ncbi:B12-binding domain-containing radical SAM protein [Candidatus Sumerlaeota bacterium]|nr:B12-binding domain-containing radical SAM protein [Candidatus Sumerlaeota bacterium]
MAFKIALIRAANPSIPYQVSMPPLGLGYIASVLRRDLRGIELTFHRDVAEIRSVEPDLVMISSASENWPESVEYAQAIKAHRDVPIVAGGMHITALPETMPDEIDLGCIGEGEDTALELVETVRRHGLSVPHLREIRGLCFRNSDGSIERTPSRPYIDPLDRLPFPDRDLLGDQWATPRDFEVHLMSSRGCPYTCHFCTATSWAKVRYFSPEYTVSEVEWLLERYQPEWIYFFDDLFVGHRKRFREICEILRTRGIHRRVKFRTYARVNLVDEELCTLMRDHGFLNVDLGIETNSEKVMAYYKKHGCSPEKNQRALDLLAEHGLSVGTNFIFGAPVETLEDLEATLDFIRRNMDKMERISVGALQAPPGSGVHADLTAAGMIDNHEFDWHRQINRPGEFHVGDDGYLMLNENVTPEQFERFMERAFALQREINLRGELAQRDRRMHEVYQRLHAAESELDSLRGSSAVRLAMGLRRLRGRGGQTKTR